MNTRPFGAASARLLGLPDLLGLMEATSKVGRAGAAGWGAWAATDAIEVARQSATGNRRMEILSLPEEPGNRRFVAALANSSVVPMGRVRPPARRSESADRWRRRRARRRPRAWTRASGPIAR